MIDELPNLMKLFNGIIPCGIENKGVTSLSEIKGETIELDGVKEIIFEKFNPTLEQILVLLI